MSLSLSAQALYVAGDNNLTLKWANKMDELESTLQLPKGLLKWLWRRQAQDEI